MKLQKFDYQLKDNKKNKSIIVVSVLIGILLVGFIIFKSFAVYEVTEPYNIIKASVAEFSAEKLKISYNLVGEKGEMRSTDEIPSKEDYEFDAEKSKCENGTEIVYDAENNTITIDENAEDTCNIYFNFIPLSFRTLYALNLTKNDILEGIPYGPDGTGVKGWYSAPDNYGTSYYFYNDGSDFYPMIMMPYGEILPIVRINGNGTVRIINNLSQFQTTFNDSDNDNAYLGLMYGDIGAQNILETQRNINKSIMLNSFDMMYTDYQYEYLLGDAIYCNDRTLYKDAYGEKEPDDTATGTGTNTTYYGSYYRIRNNTPSLICERKEDSFTSEESDLGNGLLTNKNGALSADEIYMINGEMLYAFHQIWELNTFSPAFFKDGMAYIYYYDGTSLNYTSVSYTFNIHDVMDLKYGLEYTGNGTWDELYQIIE